MFHLGVFLFGLLNRLAGPVIVCLSGVLLTHGQEALPKSLRIATYNVENYTSANRMTAEGYREAYPKSEVSKRALYEVIRVLNADVLALQEMGPGAYLDELQRDLATLGIHYPHKVLLEAQDKERCLAALSKIPFRSVQKHERIPFKYLNAEVQSKRGLLEVELETAAGVVSLWILHLKSRFSLGPKDPESALFRAAEATALRDVIVQTSGDPQKKRFLILGDFNDVKKARPVRAFLTRGKLQLSSLLEATDSRGERWTHHYAKEDRYERVDNILCSPALLASIANDGLSQKAQALILDHEECALASDHRPILVTLDLLKHEELKQTRSEAGP